MLHLCLRIQKLPVLYLRLAKFPEKQAQAQRVAQLWDLELYDMWPAFTHYYQSGRFFEVLHSYPTGPAHFMHFITGVREKREDESRYLCAVDDLLNRPKLTGVDYPWDLTFHGQKNVDDPEFAQRSTISDPVSTLGGTTVVMPLYEWTDEDVWAYIRQHDLPYDRVRYDEHDETVSPDWYPTCFACLDGDRRGSLVSCPKTQTMIPNIAVDAETHEVFRKALLGTYQYCTTEGPARTTRNAGVM